MESILQMFDLAQLREQRDAAFEAMKLATVASRALHRRYEKARTTKEADECLAGFFSATADWEQAHDQLAVINAQLAERSRP